MKDEQFNEAVGNETVPMHTNSGDSPAFIEIASRLITSTAKEHSVSHIAVVHIDNWFGERWLGFCGKIMGAAGVRNRTLKRSLVVPPFHPNRVLDATAHFLRRDGLFILAGPMPSLHIHRTSAANLRHSVRSNSLYAWYSGNSEQTRKGVLMVYVSTPAVTKAWYVMYEGEYDWRVRQHVGISHREVEEMVRPGDVAIN